MELINHTALPAELFVSEVAEDRTRVGTLIAKATFEVRGGGAVLDTEQPVPVLSTDEPVELGLLPSDVMMRFEEGLDVYVLAAAYSPSGQPAEGVEVGLRFGSYDPLVLRVFGDRQWVGDRESSAISAPAGFTRMPLTWDRAFGGKAEAWIDASTALPIVHPFNPHGRGFDATALFDGFTSQLGCPEGYPRLTEPTRWLANLEAPQAPVQGWGDAPNPVCWAPLPPDVVLPQPTEAPPIGEEGSAELGRISRAHPALRRLGLSPPLEVELTGCRPGGEPWRFVVPGLRARADYVRGEKTGSLDLWPTVLTLLPEQDRFTLNLQRSFRFRPEETDERSMRLVVE